MYRNSRVVELLEEGSVERGRLGNEKQAEGKRGKGVSLEETKEMVVEGEGELAEREARTHHERLRSDFCRD